MPETWVRGVLYRQVLEYVRRELGLSSFELLAMDPADYDADGKYPFESFCDMLGKIEFMAKEPGFVTRMAKETMTAEAKWKVLFRRLDPGSVFTSMERQAGRHHVADFEVVDSGRGRVRTSMRMWSGSRAHQELWAEFYRGRLEGILSLMRRGGDVELQRSGKAGEYFFEITWN